MKAGCIESCLGTKNRKVRTFLRPKASHVSRLLSFSLLRLAVALTIPNDEVKVAAVETLVLLFVGSRCVNILIYSSLSSLSRYRPVNWLFNVNSVRFWKKPVRPALWLTLQTSRWRYGCCCCCLLIVWVISLDGAFQTLRTTRSMIPVVHQCWANDANFASVAPRRGRTQEKKTFPLRQASVLGYS